MFTLCSLRKLCENLPQSWCRVAGVQRKKKQNYPVSCWCVTWCHKANTLLVWDGKSPPKLHRARPGLQGTILPITSQCTVNMILKLLFYTHIHIDRAHLQKRACRDTDECSAWLTFMEGCEEDPKFAFPASLVRPQSHHTHRGHQHDIVGHRGAELVL